MKKQQNQFDQLIHKINRLKRTENLLSIREEALSFIAFTAASIAIFSITELIFRGNIAFRTFLFFFLLASIIGVILYSFRDELKSFLGKKEKETIDETALRIGEKFDDLKDSFSNALQIYSNSDKAIGISKELSIAAFDEVAQKANNKDFNLIIDREKHKKKLIAFLIVFAISIAPFVFAPNSIGGALYRIANFNRSFLPPAPFSLSIEPKSAYYLRDASAEIIVRVNGKNPDNLFLYIKEQNQENFDKYTLKRDSSGVYRFPLNNMKTGSEFYAEAPWLTESVKSEIGRIIVIDRPIIKQLSGDVSQPAYAKLGSKPFDESSADVAGLRGSRVNLQILASKELSKAEIIIKKTAGLDSSAKENKDSTVISMKADGKKAYGGFAISFNGEYYIKIYDKDGQTNPDPIKYKIVAQSDLPPTIALLEPSADAQVGESATLPVKVAISDDYGFSSLKLFYRLKESKYTSPENEFKSITIPILTNELTAEIPYLWDLNKLGISPEDKYEFYLEVWDNDNITGPKSAKSQILSVRLPSLDEVLKDADNSQDKIEKDLENIYKQAEDIKKDMDELNRQLQNNKAPDWKEKKKIEDIQKKQEEIQQKFQNAQKQLEETTEKLKENQTLSAETMQKYAELQQLMKEVATDEMRQSMEKMKNALQNLSPEDMKKALKDMKFNEEDFKKSIDRTMKMLKRLQAEQKIDAMKKRADEMAKRQDELEKQTENSNLNDKNKNDELNQAQKNLENDMKKMADAAEDLEKMMKELGKDAPQKEFDDAKKDLNESGADKDMKQAGEDIQNKDSKSAKKHQSSASQKLKQFSQKMQDLKNKMEQKNKKEVARQMQKSIDDLLELSKQQQQLKESSKNLDWNSNQFNKNAEKQADINDALSNVINNLAALSQKSFSVSQEMARDLGDAMKNMGESMDKLAERNAGASSKAQEQAMGDLNKAAQKMQSALQGLKGNGSCKNPGGSGEGEGESDGENPGGSFMQKLRGLAAQQQMINQTLQQMLGQSGQQQQGKLSQEQQSQMNRLSQAQNGAQKTIEELSKEQKESAQGAKKKSTGELDKIADEMKQTLKEMQTGNINPETMKRQERILSRLLDQSKSVYERDKEEKRISRSGKDLFKASPKDIDLKTQEGKKRALEEFIRNAKQGYTKDYENLIRIYFEKLGKN